MLTLTLLADRWEVCRDGVPVARVTGITYQHEVDPVDITVTFEDGSQATVHASREAVQGLTEQIGAAGRAAYEAAARRMLGGTAENGPTSGAGVLA